MRIPGVDTLTRVPVPPIVQAAFAPVVRRSTTADGFGAPSLVAELNSPMGRDYPTSLSADGCTLYMGSDRPSGSLNYDLYMATRPAP